MKTHHPKARNGLRDERFFCRPEMKLKKELRRCTRTRLILHRVASFGVVFLFLALFACAANAQTKGTWRSSSGQWSGSGVGWERTNVCQDIHGFQDRPKSVLEYQVLFQKPELDSFGNQCVIRGAVKYKSTADGDPVLVDWFQGISVYMAVNPDRRDDWSNVMNYDDLLHDTVIIGADGTFKVEFDLRDSKRDPSVAQAFQFGISLAEHRNRGVESTSQTVVWRSTNPIESSTVQIVSIPASKKIAPELRLIDLAREWPFVDPDGTKLIRAVNGLQPLGKEKALAVLRTYVENSRELFGDDEVVFWVIRLLFEPVDLQQRIPSPMIAVVLKHADNENERSAIAREWPLNPIELVDGIPFMVGYRIGMGGHPEHPLSHIRWAEKYGVIRDQPLTPTANPLVAAEKLMNARKFVSLPDRQWSNPVETVRQQAMAMVRPKVDQDAQSSTIMGRQWKRALDSDAGRFVWDVDGQRFVSPKKE